MRKMGKGMLCNGGIMRGLACGLTAIFCADEPEHYGRSSMEDSLRQGFIGIVVQSRECIEEVNRILTRYGKVIRGRIGIPNREDETAVIGLITEGTNDEIGALTGKLGNIRGIIVKSALVPVIKRKKENEQ